MADGKRLYRIRYRDEDPACPVFTWSTRAWSAEDAVDQFHRDPDGDGWKLLSVELVDENGRCVGEPMKLA